MVWSHRQLSSDLHVPQTVSEHYLSFPVPLCDRNNCEWLEMWPSVRANFPQTGMEVVVALILTWWEEEVLFNLLSNQIEINPAKLYERHLRMLLAQLPFETLTQLAYWPAAVKSHKECFWALTFIQERRELIQLLVKINPTLAESKTDIFSNQLYSQNDAQSHDAQTLEESIQSLNCLFSWMWCSDQRICFSPVAV